MLRTSDVEPHGAYLRSSKVATMRRRRRSPLKLSRRLACDMARKRPVALAALRQLSPERRKLIVLAYLEEESRSELSARYEISSNTIKTHLRRTLLDLNASVRNQTAANEKVVVSRRRKIGLAISRGARYHCNLFARILSPVFSRSRAGPRLKCRHYGRAGS